MNYVILQAVIQRVQVGQQPWASAPSSSPSIHFWLNIRTLTY